MCYYAKEKYGYVTILTYATQQSFIANFKEIT